MARSKYKEAKDLIILHIVFTLAVVLLLLWLILLLPRRNFPGWEELSSWRYAHRGLHDLEKGRPENSMAAFRAAIDAGFGAELDVHLLADGSLAVVHDSDLSRVTGQKVLVEELTAADLSRFPLQGTEERIPLFGEVLALFEDKAPLVIELKVAGGNTAALTDKVMEALRDYRGLYCIESFQPSVLLHLKKHYPKAIRGQLAENFLKHSEVGLPPKPVAWAGAKLLSTVVTRPDFIAYRWEDRSCRSLRLMRRLYGVHEVSWTVRDRETMDLLEADGCVPIFENFVPQGKTDRARMPAERTN